MRGNLARSRSRGLPRGPIPACAGQPDPTQRWRGPPGAYPRVCGATENLRKIITSDTGLSPRVRGNLYLLVLVRLEMGPIPACAGQPAIARPARGSVGPIPACAGQPRPAGRRSGCSRAYPRVCGATFLLLALAPWVWGLSPRVRGNLRAILASLIQRGPIPACAGQPFSTACCKAGCWAYPRVCGATTSQREVQVIDKGLSPRVRGNRVAAPAEVGQGRPIPACAGQPCTR